MLSTRWLEKRRPLWIRLEDSLARTGKRGVAALAHSELQELASLYRQVASDLSVVRHDPSGGQLAQYLNQLLGRAHNLIYMGRRPESRGIVDFYREGFPRVFRQTLAYTLAATMIFLGATVAGALMALADPGFQRYIIGPRLQESIEHHQMWTHSVVAMKPVASSGIMTNNIAVTFFAFAFGITAGAGTLWILLFNGLLFGVISSACWQAGMGIALFSFVAPHGVLELPAIMIAGGAGLLLARGLLFPGQLPRRASLELAGNAAVRLLLGTVPILVLAGIVEGFLSPTDISPGVKFAVAAALFVMLLAYLFGVARGDEPRAVRRREMTS